MARFRGHHARADLLCRGALLCDPGQTIARRSLDKRRPRAEGAIGHLRDVVIGTTGLCNASCIHCPTGKSETAHVPRTPMPMPIFRKIIDGIAEHALDVTGHVSFGLFGDALVDPYVVERARYVAAVLPDVLLVINTNAAAWDPKKHGALAGLAGEVSLHCESLDPATFDDLMRPLRARNVLPKYHAVLAAFPRKVRVSVPVSRRNLGGLEAIRGWFMANGARSVAFEPLSSRCAEDRTLFDSLAIQPVKGACEPDLLDHLVIDSDGRVMSCCQDFRRKQMIGDFTTGSFGEVLRSVERAAFRRQMAQNQHDELPACRICYADLPSPDFPFDQLAAPA